MDFSKLDFGSLIGQKEVISSLKRALADNRVSHAYIFSGPEGIGKKTVARIFAGLLLCDDPHDGAVCGKCRACRLMENGSNPDLHIINTDDSSIGVDVIRGIQSDAVLRPVYSGRKVYIVEDAAKMTDQAQNCLLKTFEEPPGHVVVILLTTNYEKMLETVRSRAQHLQFRKYTREQVCQALSARLGDDRRGLTDLAADYSDGNIGMALKLAGSDEFAALRDQVLEMLPAAALGNTRAVLDFTTFLDNNKDSIDMVLDIMLLYYRDLLVIKETGNEKKLINSDKKDIILNNVRNFRTGRIIACIDAIGAVRRALRQNAGYQLAVDNLLMNIQEDNGW